MEYIDCMTWSVTSSANSVIWRTVTDMTEQSVTDDLNEKGRKELVVANKRSVQLRREQRLVISGM
jgi:hypothetical protein